MKKWLYISSLIFFISNNSLAFPQLVAGGGSTWMSSGLIAGSAVNVANPVILTVVGSGIVSLGAAELMNIYWYSDCEQQLACEVAKLNTYAGAVTGIMITAMFTNSSLAAGITGAVFLGTALTIPILTAILAGGMSYWWLKNS